MNREKFLEIKKNLLNMYNEIEKLKKEKALLEDEIIILEKDFQELEKEKNNLDNLKKIVQIKDICYQLIDKISVEYKDKIVIKCNNLRKDLDLYIERNDIDEVIENLNMKFREKISSLTYNILNDSKSYFRNEVKELIIRIKNLINDEVTDEWLFIRDEKLPLKFLILVNIELFTVDIYELENNLNEMLDDLKREELERIKKKKWFFFTDKEKTKANIKGKVDNIIENIKYKLVKSEDINCFIKTFIEDLIIEFIKNIEENIRESQDKLKKWENEE